MDSGRFRVLAHLATELIHTVKIKFAKVTNFTKKIGTGITLIRLNDLRASNKFRQFQLSEFLSRSLVSRSLSSLMRRVRNDRKGQLWRAFDPQVNPFYNQHLSPPTFNSRAISSQTVGHVL